MRLVSFYTFSGLPTTRSTRIVRALAAWVLGGWLLLAAPARAATWSGPVEVWAGDAYAFAGGGAVVFLADAAALQPGQGCIERGAVPDDRGRTALWACGAEARAFAARLAREGLVCRVARGARAVMRWVPGDAASGSAAGRLARAYPARCSSASHADVARALVAAGYAFPVGARLRAAHERARAAGVGVWARSDAGGVRHPASWRAQKRRGLGASS